MIQFLYPGFLFAAPLLLGFLIYIYRRRKNKAPKIVPTLFILKKFKTLASSRQKFFPPPRFFLEVLLLAALLFGAAGMFKKKLIENQERVESIQLKSNSETEKAEKQLKVKIESVLSEAELKIDKVPNLKIVEKADDKTVLLFHRKAPESFPDFPALFILPPDDNSLIKTEVFDAEQELVRWQSTSPILRYINVPLLNIIRGKIFTTPAWSEELITSKLGAVALAGEFKGRRYVFLGFELLPFEGKDSPITSILILNALNWLNYFPTNVVEKRQPTASAVPVRDRASLLQIIAIVSVVLLLFDVLVFRFNRA